MPVLDKLTTLVEWNVDTAGLERYETLVQQATAATASLSGAAGAADQGIASIGDVSVDVPIEDMTVEIAVEGTEELERLSADAEQAKVSVQNVGQAAQGTSSSVNNLSSSVDTASQKTSGLAANAQRTSTELGHLEKSTGSVVGKLVNFATSINGIFLSAAFLASKEIAKVANLSRSIGITTSAYLAWESVAKKVGGSGEGVVNMMSSMAGRFGKLEGLGSFARVEGAIKMLGLDFKEIEKLAPEKQFEKIMSTAKDLSDANVARSAISLLTGNEGNKMIGYLRTLDGSLEDILESYHKYNWVTDEGVAGSVKLSGAVGHVHEAVKTFLADITGRLGGVLGDVVEKFFNWAAANREVINQKVTEYIRTVSDALRWIGWGAEKIIKLVDSLGGAGTVIRGVAVAFGAWKIQSWISKLSDLASKMTLSSGALKDMKLSAAGLKSVGLTGLFGAAYLALEDLYYFLTGGKSAIGRFMDENLPKAESAMLHFFGVVNDGMTKDQKDYLTDKFREGVVDSVRQIESFFAHAKDLAANFFNDIPGKIKEGASEIYAWMGEVVDYVGEAISVSAGMLYATISGFVSSAFGKIKDDVNLVVEYISSAIGDLFGHISDFWSGVFKNISDGFMSIVNTIKGVIGSIPGMGALVSAGGPAIGSIPAFRGGINPTTNGSIVPNSGVPAWSKSGNQSVSSTTVNAPISITTAANASAQDIALAVSREMKKTFSDVKTTGVKR